MTRALVRRAVLFFVALCMAGIASGCQAIAGLGADLHDGATTLQRAMRETP